MIISVYSCKGGSGKTPIATNIALDKDFAIGTNDPYHVFELIFEDDRLLTTTLEQPFPEIPSSVDIVFDLGGAISPLAYSITSALEQSDLVIIPICNEIKALNGGVNTIREVSRFCKNVIVVCTKLEKKRSDDFVDDWTQSKDYKDIYSKVQPVAKNVLGSKIPVLPLKYSTAFNAIFDRSASIAQIMKADTLLNHAYAKTQNQIKNLYKEIDKHV